MAALLSWFIALLNRHKPPLRKNKHGLPLPQQCHLDLGPDIIKDRSVFVIGDVHGCLEELTDLMLAAKTLDPNTVFILVGDLVNKGPSSAKVIRHIKMLSRKHEAFSVRGNHDEGALRELLRYKSVKDYDLQDQYKWVTSLDDDDVEFMQSLPYTISIPTLNSIVVHAGLVPGRPLDLQELNDLTNMRNIIDMGDPFWTKGLLGLNKSVSGKAWTSFWNGPQHIYFGHDARRGLQLTPFATGLDTGCCYGIQLTGVFINGCRKVLCVKSRQPKKVD